jgi:hypothetical protein
VPTAPVLDPTAIESVDTTSTVHNARREDFYPCHLARPVHLSGRRFEPAKAAFREQLEWAMRSEIYPLRTLLLTVSGWVHRHQADVIAYLVEENTGDR